MNEQGAIEELPIIEMRNGLVLKLGALYFAIVFGAGFALGTIRVLYVAPAFGVRWAELAEMPIMLVVILLAAHFVAKRLRQHGRTRQALAVGILGLGLLLSAEIGLTILVQEQSLAEFIAGRDPISGGAYLIMLGAFAVMPHIFARR